MAEENNTTTAVAKKDGAAVVEKTNWARLHGSWKERIEAMLPDPKMIDQFMYCAEISYGKNREAFEKCTPISVINCLVTCAKYGILPDGRNAHLIPYGTECTVQFDYKGLVHVVIRDDVAKKVYCETVCANDVFEYENGEVKKHRIQLPRGAVLGAYADITLPNGEHQYEVMDLDEINKVKSCSRGASAANSPWNKFFSEMAKKSVFRRATKWLKLSPDVMDAIREDDEATVDFSAGSVSAPTKTLFAQPSPTEPAKLPEPSASVKVEPQPVETVEQVQARKAEEGARKAAQSNLPF